MRIPYGADLMIDTPIITAGLQAFKTSPTSAAGDVKVFHSRLISTTPSGKTRAFTSGGTYEIKAGDTITGATSAATAVVIGVRLTSGTWAGGDAAGTLFVRSDSGTFQSENLDVGSNSNVATIGGALAAAGLFVETALGVAAIGIPGTQLQGARGAIVFHDAAGAEWEDNAFPFETEDHPFAAYPNGCKYAGTAASIASTYLRATAGLDGYDYPAAAHETIVGPVDGSAPAGYILYIASATAGAGQAIPIAYFDYTGGAGELEFGFLGTLPFTPTGTVTYKVYEASKAPAHVVDAMAASRNAFATSLLDLTSGVESGLTLRNCLRAIAAVVFGIITGGSGATPGFKSADISANTVQGTKTRVTGVAVDSSGNRGANTVDFS